MPKPSVQTQETPKSPSSNPVAFDIDAFILPLCREQMRREIKQSKGVEVFFVGTLNTQLMVESVESYAFGNAGSVPAILRNARSGDVVIHNHPSGALEPSDADIAVSSELGACGIGSYIIDNAANQLRVVVKPFRVAGVQPVDIDTLRRWLEPGGRIAEWMTAYELRAQQLEMLNAVGRAFNRDGLAVIEAGTGVGKSMAYLLPSIVWALKNNEKVVISTGSINLQEQLIDKDIPLLQQASGLKFEASLMKGRNNYLCLRKADYLRGHPTFLAIGGEGAGRITEILEWSRNAKEGSLAELSFTPDDTAWEKVMCDADNCLRARCGFFNDCFFYNARRRSSHSQILVVNHHLLMADLAIRAERNNFTVSAVLPPFHRIIIDEAHHLESVATEHFGSRVSRGALRYALSRLVSARESKGAGQGLLAYLGLRLRENLYQSIPQSEREMLLQLFSDRLPQLHGHLLNTLESAVETLSFSMEESIDTPLYETVEIKRRIRQSELEGEFWRNDVEDPLRRMITAARPYLEALQSVIRGLGRFIEDDDVESMTPLLELKAATTRLEALIGRVMLFLGGLEGFCRWIEYRRRPNGRGGEVVYCIAPLEIGDELREKLLCRFKTVVMTSATLAVDEKFTYYLGQIGAQDPKRLGLSGADAAQPAVSENVSSNEIAKVSEQSVETTEKPIAISRYLETVLLDTPFDYDRQVLLGVPFNLPEPTDPTFESALMQFLGDALEISRGRAFVLFTSYGMLGRVFEGVAPRLESKGYPCLRQGQSSRAFLTEAFRENIGSVLFATASFWEGVDMPGETLSCLVLTRLPFRVPGEPIVEARVERMRERGQDPFYHLIVPQAVIRFRQGFGRLIRSKTDRGAIMICDRRIFSRDYGRLFLRSLPTHNVRQDSASNVLKALTEFFNATDDLT